jgi:hypothetical protein
VFNDAKGFALSAARPATMGSDNVALILLLGHDLAIMTSTIKSVSCSETYEYDWNGMRRGPRIHVSGSRPPAQ